MIFLGKKIKFVIILFFLFHLGCAKIVHRIDVLSEENTSTTSVSKILPRQECSADQVEFLLENKTASLFYVDLFKKSELKLMSFPDKAMAISLIELLRRPDTVSPGSRMQIIINLDQKINYYDFNTSKLSKSNISPYVFGIDFLSKKYKSTNISKLSSQLDYLLPASFPVDISLENFLKSNSEEIVKNQQLNAQFFKAEDFLTHFESFERSKLSKIISISSRANALEFNVDIDKFDFKSSDNLKSMTQCNFDIESDLELKEKVSEDENEKNHYFGLREGQNFFIAIISTIHNKKIKTIENTEIQQVVQPLNPIPICRFTNNELDLFVSSIGGRGRIQHLKHLKDYEIYNSKNFSVVQDILNFPRHIFLNSPDRILYESKKGRKDQLNFFLSMNFPIYHVDSIGDIIGAATFKKNNYSSLISDSRSKAAVLCTK